MARAQAAVVVVALAVVARPVVVKAVAVAAVVADRRRGGPWAVLERR